MPTRFDGDSAARSAKRLATCRFCLSRLGKAPCMTGMSTSILETGFLTSEALVASFLAISFCVILLSSLLNAYKRRKSVSFKAKSNFNPFSPDMQKLGPFEELVPMKKVRQNFLLLVAVALYQFIRAKKLAFDEETC